MSPDIFDAADAVTCNGLITATRMEEAREAAKLASDAAKEAAGAAKSSSSLYRHLVLSAAQDPFLVSRAVQQVVSCLGELATSQRWVEVRSTLRSHLQATDEMVCYCLGPLGEVSIAYQLAFFLLLANHYEIPPSKRLVFDPLHCDKDRQILQLCGCTPITFNERGRRRVHNRHTLFYMPFAPFDLTGKTI